MTPLLTTSWDDGHPLDLRLAEMLSEFGLPGTFYVPRAAPGGTMTAAQLRTLSEHFEIGGHTLDHQHLTSLSGERAVRQIADARSWIEDSTGKPCTMFCPPAGKYARRHLALIRDAGYAGLRTVELLSTDPPARQGDLYVMPTTLQAYPHGRASYLRNATKRAGWRNLLRYLKYGLPVDWERLAELLAEDAVRSGGVFHLWGHSWEVEQTEQWSRLRRVLRRLGEILPSGIRMTNGQVCEHIAGRADAAVVAAST